MNQLLLPLKRFDVPPRHVNWLWQANAAEYWERREWLYPFKTEFLRAHALSEGMDLQILKCWCGDGIWRGIEGTAPERYWDICWRCNGTGIHRRVCLLRWNLNGQIFHEPLHFNAEAFNDTDFKETFRGFIRHVHVSPSVARMAMLKLFLFYDRPRLWKWLRYSVRSWTSRKKRQLSAEIYRVKSYWRWHRDDIPF